MGENVHRLVKDHVNLQAFSDGPSQHSSHIVIDNWLYEVQLDHWMNTADMVDIFNAIMAERGETRRFFLFKEIGLFHYHAVFVEPQIVRDLRDKFGMKPVEGYEYYLEH